MSSNSGSKKESAARNILRRRVLTGGAVLAGLAATSSLSAIKAEGQPSQPQQRVDKGSRSNRLEGKVALVTGAARGIGRAVAVALAREGANVALLDIAAQIPSAQYPLATPAELEEAKRLVEAQGRKAIAIKADVRSSNEMRQAAERTIKELGKIDILVANAGLCTYVASLDKMSEAEWDDVIDINLSGVARTMRAVIPHMRDRKQGRIIVVNSCNSRFGSPGSPSYTNSPRSSYKC